MLSSTLLMQFIIMNVLITMILCYVVVATGWCHTQYNFVVGACTVIGAPYTWLNFYIELLLNYYCCWNVWTKMEEWVKKIKKCCQNIDHTTTIDSEGCVRISITYFVCRMSQIDSLCTQVSLQYAVSISFSTTMTIDMFLYIHKIQQQKYL